MNHQYMSDNWVFIGLGIDLLLESAKGSANADL